MNNEVDKFLISYKTEIDDNGFSSRVVKNLPERTDWQTQLQRAWKFTFIVTMILFACYTDVIGTLMTDIKTFIITLPLETGMTQLLYVIILPLILSWTITAICGHFAIQKLKQ
ncbi:MAG: DUF5056 domain-containing protein [Bacteroidales bacterium]|nr:DUF5056 domain-containing protein [Candidatus Liminaster caballi]